MSVAGFEQLIPFDSLGFSPSTTVHENDDEPKQIKVLRNSYMKVNTASSEIEADKVMKTEDMCKLLARKPRITENEDFRKEVAYCR